MEIDFTDNVDGNDSENIQNQQPPADTDTNIKSDLKRAIYDSRILILKKENETFLESSIKNLYLC